MLLRCRCYSITFKRNVVYALDSEVKKELVSITKKLSQPGKGILAADESPGNIGKKLAAINVENTAENRRQFRELLFTTKDIEKYISGVILFDSTVYQKTDSGVLFPKYLSDRGIIPGIKVDEGLEQIIGSKTSFLTKGITNLSHRCAEYKKRGCHFTKWRCVFRVKEDVSNYMVYKTSSEMMARYAEICQTNRLLPILEPEVLPLGSHNIKACQEVTEQVLTRVFRALNNRHIFLEGIILKSNMVMPGQDCKTKASPEEIAECTVTAFERVVPTAVPIIFLLSGGQTEEEATVHLNAISQYKGKKPWFITFCYGRALQTSAFKAWLGKKENTGKGQHQFLNKAEANSEASVGKYRPKNVK